VTPSVAAPGDSNPSEATANNLYPVSESKLIISVTGNRAGAMYVAIYRYEITCVLRGT